MTKSEYLESKNFNSLNLGDQIKTIIQMNEDQLFGKISWLQSSNDMDKFTNYNLILDKWQEINKENRMKIINFQITDSDFDIGKQIESELIEEVREIQLNKILE
jgi:hypothetical protein